MAAAALRGRRRRPDTTGKGSALRSHRRKRRRRGRLVDKGFLYKLINNRVHIGDAVHKGTAHPGENEAIITRALWDKVHGILRESPRVRAGRTRAATPALLKGLIFGPTGCAMTPTHAAR